MTDVPALMAATTTMVHRLEAALQAGDVVRARKILARYAAENMAVLHEPLPGAAKRRRTDGRADATDPEQGLRRWLRTFARYLADWELEEAAQVAAKPPAVPARFARAPRLVQYGLAAMASGRHADAREMLDFLLTARDLGESPRHLIGAARRARLLVYHGRIAIARNRDLERASSLFTAAARLAPDDAAVHAALGELHWHRGDEADAWHSFQHATAVDPHSPDGYQGMGWLAELDGRHEEAANWFDRALDALEDRVELCGRLLAPVPAGLLLAHGRRCRSRDPEAQLPSYDAALAALGDGQSALRAEIQLARAPLLADSDPLASSEAFVDAATLADRVWEEQQELLARATEVAPANAVAHWELAEAYRVHSYAEPEASQELLATAVATWDRGGEHGEPPPERSWVHVSRGLMQARIADAMPGAALAERWAGIEQLERAIVAQADEPNRWLYLSQMLRALNLRAGALVASAEAFDLQPLSHEVAVERSEALLAAGRPAEAVSAIEPVLDDQPGPWTVLAAAWALCEADRAEDALAEVDRLLERDDADLDGARIGLLELRARCLRHLGRSDEGTHREVLERTQDDGEQRGVRAWALYASGRAEGDGDRVRQARELFAQLAEEMPLNPWNDVNLGLVRLACGDPGGAEAVRSGTARFRTPAELEEVRDDLAALTEDAEPAVRAAIDELRARLAEAAREVVVGEPEDELDACDAPPEARIAIGLARVRLRLADEDWGGACDAIEALDGEIDDTILRRLRRRALVDASRHAGSLLAGSAAEAAGLLERMLDADGGASGAEAGPAQALLALARLRQGELADARVAASHAVALAEGDEEPFWSVCGPLAGDTAELWALDDLLAPGEGDAEVAARPLKVASFVPALEQLGAGDEPLHDPRPVVRLGDALIPDFTRHEGSPFLEYVSAMRERVIAETGITVPGARLTRGSHLAPTECQVELAGLPAAREPVPARTRAAGESVPFVAELLEAALRRRLDVFVTLDDALQLLAKGAHGAQSELPADRAGRLRIAAILRALAADRVPLTDPDLIRELTRKGSVRAAVLAIRKVLWSKLPGVEGAVMLTLPEDLAEEIDRVFDKRNGLLQEMASPRDAVALEHRLAAIVAGRERAALVVGDDDLRRLAQGLVRRSAPDVPVLGAGEVAAPPAASEEPVHA